MSRWRLAVGAGLLCIVGPPLLLPALGLLDPASWSAWRNAGRLTALATSTSLLAGGCLLITLPLGTALAALLAKSDLPGRRFWQRFIVVSLFIPLPLATIAWQSGLGGLPIFTAAQNRMWASGLWTAIGIHSFASLPWVVWLVGQGLEWVESETEDDARLAVGSWAVLFRVSIPRAAPAILAASVWVVMQVTTEITVTDMTLVRTFAEEVYSQSVLPDPEWGSAANTAPARMAAIAFPPMVLTAVAILMAASWIDRRRPPLVTAPRDRPVIELGTVRWPLSAVVGSFVLGLLIVPTACLIDRLGLGGSPPAWSGARAQDVLHNAAKVHAGVIFRSVGVALAVGIAAAMTALLSAWLARDSKPFAVLVVTLAAFCWAAPGPVIGVGLKQTFERAMTVESQWDGHFVFDWLHGGPSYLPVVWADFVRLWPFALALVWPAVHAVPRELVESARVDGATPNRELWLAFVPLSAGALVRAAMAVGVLALGELSASKMVATPQGETLSHNIFAQMHYGVTPTLAAQCLLLLAVVLPFAVALPTFHRDAARSATNTRSAPRRG